jgi:hypothetical protein
LREWENWFEERVVDVLEKIGWVRGGRVVYIRDWEGRVVEVMTRGALVVN